MKLLRGAVAKFVAFMSRIYRLVLRYKLLATRRAEDPFGGLEFSALSAIVSLAGHGSRPLSVRVDMAYGVLVPRDRLGQNRTLFVLLQLSGAVVCH